MAHCMQVKEMTKMYEYLFMVQKIRQNLLDTFLNACLYCRFLKAYMKGLTTADIQASTEAITWKVGICTWINYTLSVVLIAVLRIRLILVRILFRSDPKKYNFFSSDYPKLLYYFTNLYLIILYSLFTVKK